MGFVEAVRTVLFKKYATFDGRASRSEYWWFMLFQMLVSFLCLLIGIIVGDTVLGNPNGPGVLTTILFSVTWLAFLIPSLAVGWRRFHDRNMSGIWYLVLAILLIPVVWVICMLKGRPEANQYGAPLV